MTNLKKDPKRYGTYDRTFTRDYFDMTDEELEVTVTNRIFGANYGDGRGGRLIRDLKTEKFHLKYPMRRFDPLHDPKDAWEIIESHDISLNKVKARNIWMASADVNFRGFSGTVEVGHTNPFRAAVIVFMEIWDIREDKRNES